MTRRQLQVFATVLSAVIAVLGLSEVVDPGGSPVVALVLTAGGALAVISTWLPGQDGRGGVHRPDRPRVSPPRRRPPGR